MDNNIIVLNENQLEDVIYKTVSRCLDERIVNSLVNSQSDNDCAAFCTLPTQLSGELKRPEYYKVRKWDVRISIPSRKSTNSLNLVS